MVISTKCTTLAGWKLENPLSLLEEAQFLCRSQQNSSPVSGTTVVIPYTRKQNKLNVDIASRGEDIMLYTICAIVRRRLEQEKNPELRETILDILTLLESNDTTKLTPQEVNA